MIPFDPQLDPEPFTCYNCWSDDHPRRDCPEPPLHAYCRNCGRKDVEVQDCPRCAEAYREFLKDWEGKHQESRRLSKALYESRQFYREEDLIHVDPARLKSVNSEQGRDREVNNCCDFEVRKMSTGFCEQFECSVSTLSSDEEVFVSVMGSSDGESVVKKKFESDCYSDSTIASSELAELLVDDGIFCSDTDDGTETAPFRRCNSANSYELYEQKSSDDSVTSFNDEGPAFSKSLNDLFVQIREKKIQDELSGDKSLYRFDDGEDDVDYDNVIVDENERSESLCSKDHAIQEFLDLLDKLKHLSIEVQNLAVFHYVSERKKMYWQNQEKIFCNGEFL